MGRFEQDYRETLDGLAFSGAGKERIMKNLMKQQEGRTVKGKRFRVVRAVILAAAVCLALAGTAFAATAAVRQGRTYFLNSRDEVLDIIESAQVIDDGKDAPGAVAVGGGFNKDYEYKSTADDTEEWWDAYGLTPLEETVGTEEDGWARMRKFQREGFLELRYLAETLSGFNSLWASTPWDTTWLEEHYSSVSNGQTGYMKIKSGETAEFSLCGEFQGEDGAAFTVQFSKGDRPYADSVYQMTTGYDYTETYQTPDGVEVSIKMGTANSGKTVFWADFTAGYNSFGMWGTELELDDIHDILDSLNLSALPEYEPK